MKFDEKKINTDVEKKTEKPPPLRLETLASVILSSQFGTCPSLSREECEGICEDIIESTDMLETLCDYLDLTTEEAEKLLRHASGWNSIDGGSDSDSDIENNDEDENLDDDYEDDDGRIGSADDYIQEGECELCEREMKLTLHHLIPKCTWKHIKPRFLEAAEYYRKDQMKKVKETLDLGQELPVGISLKTFKSGIAIKLFLANYTASLCAPCHKCVHKHHSNMELAEKFNSVEKILEDERIHKFCKWQSKQKVSRYALNR